MNPDQTEKEGVKGDHIANPTNSIKKKKKNKHYSIEKGVGFFEESRPRKTQDLGHVRTPNCWTTCIPEG